MGLSTNPNSFRKFWKRAQADWSADGHVAFGRLKSSELALVRGCQRVRGEWETDSGAVSVKGYSRRQAAAEAAAGAARGPPTTEKLYPRCWSVCGCSAHTGCAALSGRNPALKSHWEAFGIPATATACASSPWRTRADRGAPRRGRSSERSERRSREASIEQPKREREAKKAIKYHMLAMKKKASRLLDHPAWVLICLYVRLPEVERPPLHLEGGGAGGGARRRREARGAGGRGCLARTLHAAGANGGGRF